MVLRVITWITFAICLAFAYFTTALPGHYYLVDPAEVHHSDYVIGWFWMTVFGFFSAVVLLGLVFLQRKESPRWRTAIWAVPTIPVLVSAAVLFLQSVRS